MNTPAVGWLRSGYRGIRRGIRAASVARVARVRGMTAITLKQGCASDPVSAPLLAVIPRIQMQGSPAGSLTEAHSGRSTLGSASGEAEIELGKSFLHEASVDIFR